MGLKTKRHVPLSVSLFIFFRRYVKVLVAPRGVHASPGYI